MVEAVQQTPYEAQLFARGRMNFGVVLGTDTKPTVINTNLPEQKARDIWMGDAITAIWYEAFSGKVPQGWDESSIAFSDIKRVPVGERLSQDLILAGITYPDDSVRVITIVSRVFTPKEMAVALAFNDSLIESLIIRHQFRKGFTHAQFEEAIALSEKATLDDSVSVINLIRGEF